MENKRNALVDITRVAAAAGIILCHVDLSGYGAMGVLFGQFLSVRFSVMFFLAIIGFYVEKSCREGKGAAGKRVRSFLRVYGAWSLVYLALSFVMSVLIQEVPVKLFLVSKVKGLLFSGSYYHFWFYPAVIYSLLFIGGVKKLLGDRTLHFLVPLALTLYVVGLLGTGYLPIGQKVPILRNFYGGEAFETVMHLFFLGFPSIVLGMAVAQKNGKCSGYLLLLAVAAYVSESMMLCMCFGWRENPQMLISTPVLTMLFLKWVQNKNVQKKLNLTLLRVVSSGMYNVHPLFLAVFAVVIPNLNGLWTFLLCTVCSVVFGWMLHCFRKIKLIGMFV